MNELNSPQEEPKPFDGKKVNYKRRIVVVNKSLQFKVAAVTLLLFVLAAFSVWWEIYSAFGKLAGTGVLESSPTNISIMVSQVSKIVLIKIILFLGLVWVFAIALSHYVAGPIYRFQATLKSLQVGDLTQRIHLRKFDQLKNIAEDFNKAMEFLHSTMSEERRKIKSAQEKLRQIQPRVDKTNGDTIDSVIKDLDSAGSSFKI